MQQGSAMLFALIKNDIHEITFLSDQWGERCPNRFFLQLDNCHLQKTIR